MNQRSGPFWNAPQGRAPLSRAAATLGLELIEADVEAGTIKLAFATEDFTNPTGNVLGAIVAAMLCDTVGPALLARGDGWSRPGHSTRSVAMVRWTTHLCGSTVRPGIDPTKSLSWLLQVGKIPNNGKGTIQPPKVQLPRWQSAAVSTLWTAGILSIVAQGLVPITFNVLGVDPAVKV